MNYVLEERKGDPDNKLEKPGANQFRFCVQYRVLGSLSGMIRSRFFPGVERR